MKTAKITIGGVYVGDYITSFNLSPKQAAEQFKDLAYFHKKEIPEGVAEAVISDDGQPFRGPYEAARFEENPVSLEKLTPFL
jgi:hypothetical protein